YACFGLPRRVYALGGHLSPLEVDVEDVASVLFEFDAGSRRFPLHVHLDYVQLPAVRVCEILGEQGRIVLDFDQATVDDLRPDGTADQFAAPEFRRNDMFVAELRHFLACLRGEESPRVGIRDGAASVRMALAARRSLTTGQPVVL
ncbi:MAG TPA: Gfo/Idh/MocA family oxidoreductase, partial [Vicinamibacteria bacterium]